jgi:hypothetical protein
MKLDIRINNGKPFVLFTDTMLHDKNVECYSDEWGYGSTPRSFGRSLPKPETSAELSEAWLFLLNLCNDQINGKF